VKFGLIGLKEIIEMSNIKKCLMVQQPYASQIAFGEKTIEIRSYKYSYRGELLIGASKTDQTGVGKEILPGIPFPRGVIVGLVKMVDCIPYTADMCDASQTDYEDAQDLEAAGMWAWVFEHIAETKPLAVSGQVRPFDFDATGLELIDEETDPEEHPFYFARLNDPNYQTPWFEEEE
jgi:hypothetical protein